jgi:glycosyltransferase involved in cell wall biosynthesis
MKIGFDAKRYFHNRTGLGNYSRDLVNELCVQFPSNNYFLFDKKPDLSLVPNNAIAVAPHRPSSIWRVHGMIKEMQLYQLDVFHGLSNELPYGKYPKQIKKIVTIHDVIFRLFPEQYALIDRSIYHEKTRHAVKIADTVIATSKATANDLMHFYHQEESKIKVVYQTCGEAHKADHSEASISHFRNIYHLQEPYLLYVSSFQTRKNHLPLIKAFAALKQNKVKLVLAGRKGETYDNCVRLIKALQLENMVNLVDDISYENLPLLYRGAQGFIYPSMIEGFGIPLTEAAFAGLPMAVNDIAVFREIAPEGTLFFDVNQSDSMVNALQLLLQIDKNTVQYSEHLKQFDSVKISKQLIGIYG